MFDTTDKKADIISGSAAAVVQSGIGNIAAGGLFSTLQSAAAGGYGVAAVHGVVQTVGGVVASAGGLSMGWLKKL